MSSSGSVEEPLESSAGGDDLSSANKPAEPSGATLDQVQSDESSKTSSPSYEQDKKADDGNNDDTDVESSFSKPAAITRRKLSDYVPPEEQVILEKVTAVDPEKPYRTPEPSEQEQLEKSIASIIGDIPADAAESDLSNYFQSAPEPELVVKRTVISQEETESAVNALLGESFESFEEPVGASAPHPVDSLDDDHMGSCADDEAAAAVAGLATEMSPDNNEDWHNRMAMHQAKQADKEAVETAVANIPCADKQDENDESIENIAAEIRRSSIENEERRRSVESKDSDVEAVVDDMEEESPGRLGKALAEESLTPRRGRSAVSSLQPSPAVQHLPLVPMPGYRVADGGIPITALVSQASSPSQEVLIDSKTGHFHAPVETGQRVSLGKRDGTKEFELEVKPRDQLYQPLESTHHQPPLSQAQVKVQRDYLQPRDREAHRPASTPNSSSQQQQQLKEDEKQQSHVYLRLRRKRNAMKVESSGRLGDATVKKSVTFDPIDYLRDSDGYVEPRKGKGRVDDEPLPHVFDESDDSVVDFVRFAHNFQINLSNFRRSVLEEAGTPCKLLGSN